MPKIPGPKHPTPTRAQTDKPARTGGHAGSVRRNTLPTVVRTAPKMPIHKERPCK